jgi:hypothetical protein
VARVLLLPLDNETTFPKASEEVRKALAAELQQMGRFEVVPAPPDVHARLSGEIRYEGRFNEAVMIQLARIFRADVIVLGTLSHYHPYPQPRIGLTLQAVSPGDCKVVASVDGLWDAAQPAVKARARAFYAQGRAHPLHPGLTDNEGFAGDLALASPALFQRFVCNEAASVLVQPPPGLGPLPDGVAAPCCPGR